MSAEVSDPKDGEPLFDDATVLRLFGASGPRAAPEHFELSSRDRQAPDPSLSVWEETRTSLEHARSLGPPRVAYAAFLPVARVRAMRPDPDRPAVQLQVCWEKLLADDGKPDSRPGASGHCGIRGLHVTGHAHDKARRTSLRVQLARLANATRVEALP